MQTGVKICQKMAPTMLQVEEEFSNKIDIVLLNVDNERWSYLIDKYDVNGIPQFNYFDQSGQLRGRSIGFLTYPKILGFSKSLLFEKEINSEVDNITSLESDFSELSDSTNTKNINPRSHG